MYSPEKLHFFRPPRSAHEMGRPLLQHSPEPLVKAAMLTLMPLQSARASKSMAAASTRVLLHR